MFSPSFISQLKDTALDIRSDILKMAHLCRSTHVGGSLSSVEILTSLYFGKLFNLYPEIHRNPSSDHFILSAGHLCPAYYSVLCRAGFFPEKLLFTYSHYGSPLQGHASTSTPGVEYSSGSLGQGLSVAAGLALAQKRDRQRSFTLCLTTDGEHNEGQVWEAIMFAAKYKLNHLINIVDLNGMQIMGSTDTIMPLPHLSAKYYEFGWQVYEINGHHLPTLLRTLRNAKESADKPVAIITRTVFGKGVSFMEDNHHYHGVKSLSKPLYEKAQKELSKQSKNRK